VIDQSQPLSDPTVITGSHNWSSTAENTNDENTVIVHDARVSNLFYQEFRGLLVSMGVIGVEDVEGELALAIFPNPTSDILYVEVSEKLIGESLTLVDVNGRNVIQLNVNELRSNIDVSRLESGVYFLSAPSINKTLRVLIQ
jgi:phosphatidylserine/phosphatidylglycerophosphate/cardiolipin synthase-like enzyme